MKLDPAQLQSRCGTTKRGSHKIVQQCTLRLRCKDQRPSLSPFPKKSIVVGHSKAVTEFEEKPKTGGHKPMSDCSSGQRA